MTFDNDGPTEDEHLLATMARLKDVEAAMLAFAEDFKYPMTLPRGSNQERAVLLLDYLIPDLQHILATHYISRGWRRHDELAIIKPRKVIGGVFEDLVAYVPVDQPDDPIVVGKDPIPPTTSPPVMPDLWSVKPVVRETFEERPTDE
jgi:hypothetical protein